MEEFSNTVWDRFPPSIESNLDSYRPQIERMLSETEGQGVRKRVDDLINSIIIGSVIIGTRMSGSVLWAFQ